MRTLSFLFVALFLLAIANGKTMWGSRKKKETDKDSTAAVQAKHHVKKKSPHKVTMEKTSSVGSNQDFATLLVSYFQFLDEIVESDKFSEFVNPKSIRKLVGEVSDAFPDINLKNILNQPEYSDPKLLRETVRTGVKMMKDNMATLVDTVNDPIKLASFMEDFPPEVQRMFSGLINGDMNEVIKVVEALPGLTDENREMVVNMLQGKSEEVMKQLKQTVALPSKGDIEKMRQQFLQDLDSAAALGVTEEMLQDPVQWEAMVMQGLQLLGLTGEGGDGLSMENLFAGMQGAGAGRASVEVDGLFDTLMSGGSGKKIQLGDGEEYDVDALTEKVKNMFAQEFSNGESPKHQSFDAKRRRSQSAA